MTGAPQGALAIPIAPVQPFRYTSRGLGHALKEHATWSEA